MILDLSAEEWDKLEKWADTKSWGWPIRVDCPPEIRLWIEGLKDMLGDERGALPQEERIRNLTETVGEERELERVRKIIADHRWIFAKTYAAFCPHEYTLRKEWKKDEDFWFLINFIWRNGLEAYFGKKILPNRYWFDHENGYYYFIFPDDTDEEGNTPDKVILLNRAKICDFDFWKDEERGIIRCARHREICGEDKIDEKDTSNI